MFNMLDNSHDCNGIGKCSNCRESFSDGKFKILFVCKTGPLLILILVILSTPLMKGLFLTLKSEFLFLAHLKIRLFNNNFLFNYFNIFHINLHCNLMLLSIIFILKHLFYIKIFLSVNQA